MEELLARGEDSTEEHFLRKWRVTLVDPRIAVRVDIVP